MTSSAPPSPLLYFDTSSKEKKGKEKLVSAPPSVRLALQKGYTQFLATHRTYDLNVCWEMTIGKHGTAGKEREDEVTQPCLIGEIQIEEPQSLDEHVELC